MPQSPHGASILAKVVAKVAYATSLIANTITITMHRPTCLFGCIGHKSLINALSLS